MSESDIKEHKARRGGRTARRAERANAAPPQLPFVQRRVGTYSLLDEEGLSLIERNADLILQEVGMEFRDDPEVLEIFRRAGADVVLTYFARRLAEALQ